MAKGALIPSLHEIAFAGHRMISPFSDEQLMLLGRVARINSATQILDFACGKGEMLCRWAEEFGSDGLGVDTSDGFVSAARARAVELDVADRVRFEVADAATYQTDQRYDVVSCLGAFDILPGGFDQMRAALSTGGLLLVGDLFWMDREPSVTGYLPPGTVPTLPGMLDRFDDAGVELVEMVLADAHSWERFEAAQWWALTAWLTANPGDGMAAEVRRVRHNKRRDYLTWARQNLGWGVFVLRAA